jgi:SIR2-like protein
MEKLKQVLAQEDTVLFIGSGISMWSGLPSWSGMIEELAQFLESNATKPDLVRAEAQKGDLLQAASYGFDKLTKQQIGDFIRSACRYGVARPHEIHRKIVSLGPRCFITTNYDNLIEEGLREWQPDRFFPPPITNRHLTETAKIVHARAIDFIFKPHGDAADSESIILTREQYRQLLPQGERQAALESLKMLMASRPVVYFGFGLRDADFIYVRDLLANTYKGGIRDHYAIMADVSDAENDYWRRNYGIHLINYATNARPDKTNDHTALLTLLDTLLEKAPMSPVRASFDPGASDVVLALARHAASLTRSPKIEPEFHIRVHAGREPGIKYWLDKFDHSPVEKFLDNGPQRALLIGLPGAGKTYSLHRAAARLAEKLHEVCLSEPFNKNAVIIPILADLKLYQGNLHELVSQTLPKSIALDEVTRHFKVKIFLDSFNEMPRTYLESGSYESDFIKFTTSIGNSSFVIGSRSKDGLNKLGLPAYHLDEIDEETVTAELQRLGIEIGGRFDRDVRRFLQRPFYFRYITSGEIRLPKAAQPRDFHQVFFQNLTKSFATRFGQKLGIEKVLSLAAYDALNRGEEAYPLSEFLRIIKTSAETARLVYIDALDIANWLVSSSVLIPHIGGRVAFVHQSVTEYLAATELARRYQASPYILKEKLSLRRWDQALFVTLSLLPPTQANQFLQDVIDEDFALALNAVKYLEMGRDEVVSKLLSELPERVKDLGSDRYKIQLALESDMPLTDVHEPLLRMLIKQGSSIGATAAKYLVALKGKEVKDELLQLLIDNSDDYNLCCNGIGPALRPFATEEDTKKIVVWADSIQDTLPQEYDELQGFIGGSAAFLAELDLSIIRREFLPQEELMEIPEIRALIICGILEMHSSTAALDFAGELLLQGVDDAANAICLVHGFGKSGSELSWSSFTSAHVGRLEAILDEGFELWGLDALKYVCAERPDLAKEVEQRALKKSGLEKAALLYCASPNDLEPIFQALGELIKMSNEERREQPIRILQHLEFDWTGKAELFVQLLKLRDTQLASALFGGSIPPTVPNLGSLEIGHIDWWLEWMMETLESDSSTNPYWFLNQLGGLFASNLTPDIQDKFVAEFNNSNSRFRSLLLQFILPYWSDITTEVFSEDTVSFLLADLSREINTFFFRGHLLGIAATEQFIIERLIPLLPSAKQPLLKNLHQVLRQAGYRHGRRYVPEYRSV